VDRWDDADLIGLVGSMMSSFSRWFDRTTRPKEHVAHRAPCALQVTTSMIMVIPPPPSTSAPSLVM
jgi:hypothetical protein